VAGAEATLTEQERDARVLAKTRLALLAREQHTTLTPLRIVAQVCIRVGAVAPQVKPVKPVKQDNGVYGALSYALSY
jgi:hypothetical protein